MLLGGVEGGGEHLERRGADDGAALAEKIDAVRNRAGGEAEAPEIGLEEEERAADAEEPRRLVGGEHDVVDAPTVDEGAVLGAEVADAPAAGFPGDFGVLAGEARIGEGGGAGTAEDARGAGVEVAADRGACGPEQHEPRDAGALVRSHDGLLLGGDRVERAAED